MNMNNRQYVNTPAFMTDFGEVIRDLAAHWDFRQYLCSEEGAARPGLDCSEVAAYIGHANPPAFQALWNQQTAYRNNLSLRNVVIDKAHAVVRDLPWERVLHSAYRFSNHPELAEADKPLIQAASYAVHFYTGYVQDEAKMEAMQAAQRRRANPVGHQPIEFQISEASTSLFSRLNELSRENIKVWVDIIGDFMQVGHTQGLKYRENNSKLVHCEHLRRQGFVSPDWHPNLSGDFDADDCIRTLQQGLEADLAEIGPASRQQRAFDDPRHHTHNLIDIPEVDSVIGTARAMASLFYVHYEKSQDGRQQANGGIDNERFIRTGLAKIINSEVSQFDATLFNANMETLGMSAVIFEESLGRDLLKGLLSEIFLVCTLALHSHRFYIYNLVFLSLIDGWHDKADSQGLFAGDQGALNLDSFYHIRQFAEGLLHSCTVGSRQVQFGPRERSGEQKADMTEKWLKMWSGTGLPCADPGCIRPLLPRNVPAGQRAFKDAPMHNRLSVGVNIRRGILRSHEIFQAFRRESSHNCLVGLFPHPYHPKYLVTLLAFGHLMHFTCRAQRGKPRRGGGGGGGQDELVNPFPREQE